MRKETYGYSGKILRVLLGKATTKVEDVDPENIKKFLGGVGYAAKILYDELPKGINPFDPRNKIVFATGPLTGTSAPGSGSVLVCFKSPLTNIWAESRAGGDWGPALKKAGYDFLVIEGKSEEPVYLVISNEKVEIKPAEDMKGKSTSDKIKAIRGGLGDPEIEVAVIGPAGENLVRFSNIMFGERTAGRCGAGAVMGSKNLLGIAVKGSNKIPAARPSEFFEAVKKSLKIIVDNPRSSAYRKHGTIGDLPDVDTTGDWPTKNWRSNSWGKGQELLDYFKENNYITNKPCYTGCPISCGRIASVKSGEWKTPRHEGSEYESISVFTAFVLNDNMDAAVHGTYLCNEYGLDTISTGAAIAFAMDCYENGIINREDAGGLDLSWGNAKSIVEIVNKISRKEGIGELLSEGVMRASKKLGKGSEKLAIHVKGLEGPAHDPRSGKALAVAYGTSNRGMCHIHPVEAMAYDNYKVSFGLVPYGVPDPNKVDRFAERGKGKIVKTLQDFGVIPDVLGVCKILIYVGIGLDQYAEMVSALTGWELDGWELLKVGERVINLQRLFNVREGVTRENDDIPERVKKLPEFGQYEKTEECRISNYGEMLNEYYDERGWDAETGAPKQEKLNQLGIILHTF